MLARLKAAIGAALVSAAASAAMAQAPQAELLPPVDGDFDVNAVEPAPPPPPSPHRLSAGPFGGRQAPFRISGFWAPPQDVSGQNSTLALSGVDLNASLPISMDPELGRMWVSVFTFDHRHLATNAVLPDSGIEVPEDLWNVNVGVLHSRNLANGKTAGGMLTVGSAADHPFDAGRDLVYTALGFMTIPARNGRDDWSLSVYYSPTAQIPYPLPGLAYVWRPSEMFQASLGLPASLVYRPTPTRTLTVHYTPIWNLKVELREQLDAFWSLYTAYQTDTDAYFLSERLENNQRFYLFEQRASIGLERKLAAGFVLDVAMSYLFDRQLFQARGFGDARSDELGIDPGPAASLQLRWFR